MKKYGIVLLLLSAIGVVFLGVSHVKTKAENLESKGSESYAMYLKETEDEETTKQAAKEKTWEDKEWYVIGDSFTYDNQYQKMIQNSLRFSSIYTDASPGRAISGMDDDLNIDKISTADLITVFGGTNDYGGSRKLGNIQDTKESSTFYGDLKAVIENIQATKKDTAKIVLLTPTVRGEFEVETGQPVYPNSNGAGYTLEEYVKAIKEVAKEYSLEVIDLFEESGITLTNLEKVTRDNLHPTEEGYQMIADIVSNKLNETGPTAK